MSTLLSALAIGIAISVIMGQPPQGHPKKPVCRLVLNPWDASLRTRERERESNAAPTNQFQDLDRVLYDAQHRRTADLLGWLKQFIRDRRQSRTTNWRTAAIAGAPAPGP